MTPFFRYRAKITEKLLLLSLFIYFSSGKIIRKNYGYIFNIISKIYPTTSRFYALLKSSVSEYANWVQSLNQMANYLSFGKRYRYINSFLNVFYRSKIQRLIMSSRYGCPIPMVIILSLTSKCNLNCSGCYAKRFDTKRDVFDLENIHKIILRSSELGIYNYLLAGGEPLLFNRLLDITKNFPNQMFFLFTNSILLDNNIFDEIGRASNIIPVLSTDISELFVTKQRGDGVYVSIKNCEEQFIQRCIPYGKSVIVNSDNYKHILDDSIRNSLFTKMCKAVVFLKYVGNDTMLMLSTEQSAEFNRVISSNRSKDLGIVFNFPEDEYKYFNKCGKAEALLHIAPDGTIEPCPFDKTTLGNILEEDLLEILQNRSRKYDQTRTVCCEEHSKLV